MTTWQQSLVRLPPPPPRALVGLQNMLYHLVVGTYCTSTATHPPSYTPTQLPTQPLIQHHEHVLGAVFCLQIVHIHNAVELRLKGDSRACVDRDARPY